MGAAKRREFCQSEVHCSGSATSTPVGGAAEGGGRGGLPKPAISPRRRAAAHEWGGGGARGWSGPRPPPPPAQTQTEPHTPRSNRETNRGSRAECPPGPRKSLKRLSRCSTRDSQGGWLLKPSAVIAPWMGAIAQTKCSSPMSRSTTKVRPQRCKASVTPTLRLGMLTAGRGCTDLWHLMWRCFGGAQEISLWTRRRKEQQGGDSAAGSA